MRALARLLTALALTVGAAAHADEHTRSFPSFLTKADPKTKQKHKMKWNVADIRYHFVEVDTAFPNGWDYDNCTPMHPFSTLTKSTIPFETIKQEVLTAMARWSAVTQVTFTESRSASDATLFFGVSDALFGIPAVATNLELSRQPEGENATFRIMSGAVCFRADHPWHVRADGADAAIHVGVAAGHEIGHVLGLDHPSDESALMYYKAQASPELRASDIAGIVDLYGTRVPPNLE